MEILSNILQQIHWYNKCKILSDQCLMLACKFPVMIFIFTYFICHVCHKLNVTCITKLDAIIIFALFSYWKKLSIVPISISRVFLQCIHFKFKFQKVLSEKILFTLTFFKKVHSLMSHKSRRDLSKQFWCPVDGSKNSLF